MNMLEKSTLPRSKPIGGIKMSPTKEAIILPKAPPMMIPTAMSSTWPRMANSLNCFNTVWLLVWDRNHFNRQRNSRTLAVLLPLRARRGPGDYTSGAEAQAQRQTEDSIGDCERMERRSIG